MNYAKIDKLLVEAIEQHDTLGLFVLLGVMSFSCVFVLTQWFPEDQINNLFKSLNIPPTVLLILFVLANIYSFTVLVNRHLFKKKLFALAKKEGLSKTEIEIFLIQHRVRNAALDGNLHGRAKKNVERLRRG